jgi:hypothetical protein
MASDSSLSKLSFSFIREENCAHTTKTFFRGLLSSRRPCSLMVPDAFVVLDRDGVSGLEVLFCTAITILAISATCSEVMPSGCNIDGVIFRTGLAVEV